MASKKWDKGNYGDERDWNKSEHDSGIVNLHTPYGKVTTSKTAVETIKSGVSLQK